MFLIRIRMLLSNDDVNAGLFPSRIAFFSWDLAADKVYGDAVLAELFEIDAASLAEGVSIMPMVERIAGEDRPHVARSIHGAIITGELYRERYRIDHSKRGMVEVMATGRCLKDNAGTPSVYNGVVMELDGVDIPLDTAPLERHCLSALGLAERQGNELAARYLSSALRVIGKAGRVIGPR
jgi:hypothetical protein